LENPPRMPNAAIIGSGPNGLSAASSLPGRVSPDYWPSQFLASSSHGIQQHAQPQSHTYSAVSLSSPGRRNAAIETGGRSNQRTANNARLRRRFHFRIPGCDLDLGRDGSSQRSERSDDPIEEAQCERQEVSTEQGERLNDLPINLCIEVGRCKIARTVVGNAGA